VAIFPWNWGRRAKAFLGDSGSYLLGSSVGLLALVVFGVSRDPLVAFGPLAIYLADTGVTLFMRARRRASLLQPHREHAFQRFAEYSNHQIATSIVVTFSALVSLVAIAAQHEWIDQALAYALTAALIIVYLAGPNLFRRLLKAA
jgi:UDP-GlcNAc:undecaprenyl-phosphate GlcNAc-1-phosphate transferase